MIDKTEKADFLNLIRKHSVRLISLFLNMFMFPILQISVAHSMVKTPTIQVLDESIFKEYIVVGASI